jgi:hypothetical protein
MDTITVRMTWTWGGSRQVRCSKAQTIHEVACENGFLGVADRDPLFLSQGQILAAELTLHGNGVRDGQTVLAYLPRGACTCPVDRGPFAGFPRFQSLPDIERLEAWRAADRTFANWEMECKYPLVLADLLHGVEAEEGEYLSTFVPQVTVVRPAAGISDTPLPGVTDPEGMAGVPGSWGVCEF